MKIPVLAFHGVALIAIAPAYAQQSGTIELEGEAPSICSISGEGFSNLPFGSIQRSVDLSNPQAFPNVFLNLTVTCSENFVIGFTPTHARFENVDVVTGALQPVHVGDAYIHDGSPVPGFVGGIKYTLNATLGGVTLPSGGGGPSYTSPGFGPGVGFFTSPLSPRTEPLLVTFNPTELPPSVNLLAGEYRETITIQLTPQGI